MKVAEWNYKEYDRLLREQFINGLDDKDMINAILREVSGLNIEHAIREGVLFWFHRMEVQRSQKVVINSIIEARV